MASENMRPHGAMCFSLRVVQPTFPVVQRCICSISSMVPGTPSLPLQSNAAAALQSLQTLQDMFVYPKERCYRCDLKGVEWEQ